MASDDKVAIGTFGRAHGVRGEIRFFPYNPQSDLFEESDLRVFVHRGDDDEPFDVERLRRADKFFIVKLGGVDDRDQAQALTNLDVWVAAEQLPALDEDEFYLRDLVGLAVEVLESADGPTRVIGEVGGFFETGANDVMVVELGDDQTLFVPLIEDAVAEIDPDSTVVLQPLHQWAPEGTDIS
jgi:16S rRNA processing protein RimM